ncbi:MAG: HAMP domain-containing sensor histidine kinase [Halioglobus sp.]
MLKFRKVLTSLTFRYIAKYLAVLTVSVFVLLGALYGYFSYTFFGSLGDTIVDELETLQIVYTGQSLEGVNAYIEDQYKRPAANRFYYLVVDEQGVKVAGDLDVSPRYREFSGGWLGFDVALLRWGRSEEFDFLARRANLGNGYQVLVAGNYADAISKSSLVFSTLFRAMIATLILGLIGGFFSAQSTLNRVETLNRELSRIIRGDPSERLQLVPEEGYVRELSLVMNSMLDQMESLMQGVQRVSDNIAHDLRTPLTRMRNQLTQLRAGSEQIPTDQIDGIIEECDELLTTFNALLRISTLETGKRSIAAVNVDLGQLLQDVVELYEPLAQEKNIELLYSPQSKMCKGEADLLFQMFANLLDNAVKYTPPHGRIEILMESIRGGASRVVIADTGPGIAAADRKNVFRRFFRVESSRSEQPGHGLGLSLVQAIARYHNGTVDLLANSPGLLVRVVLP